MVLQLKTAQKDERAGRPGEVRYPVQIDTDLKSLVISTTYKKDLHFEKIRIHLSVYSPSGGQRGDTEADKSIHHLFCPTYNLLLPANASPDGRVVLS